MRPQSGITGIVCRSLRPGKVVGEAIGGGGAGCSGRCRSPGRPAGAARSFMVRIRSVRSRRTVPAQRSAKVVAFGDLGGERRTCTPAPAGTASKASENFPSLSRRKNRNRSTRSPRSIITFLTCCVTQSRLGCTVTPRMCTRHVTTSVTNSTYSRRHNGALRLRRRNDGRGVRSRPRPAGHRPRLRRLRPRRLRRRAPRRPLGRPRAPGAGSGCTAGSRLTAEHPAGRCPPAARSRPSR